MTTLSMEQILLFVIAGFIAQIIDGTLGMAYGISATSLMLAFGVPPASASASVHAAEVITTGISGLAHHGHGNIDWRLARRLLIPGVIGAAIGAYVLTAIPADTIRPIVSAYLLVMGVVILRKALQKHPPAQSHTHLVPLGLFGGFLDATGGGGWGTIVTTTLIARGHVPRFAIGSVNAVEFFVSLAASITFVLTIGLLHWQAIVGLAIGGALAAPLAAYLTKRMPARPMMFTAGILIILLSARTIILAAA